MRSLAWALFLLLISFSLLAQNPGDLDTTFRVQTNYGPNRVPEKTYLMPNGGILLYAPSAMFSGKKVGPLMKVKPNGDLDTSFRTPDFTFYFTGFSDNFFRPDANGTFLPISDGSVYFFPIESKLYANGVFYPETVRFSPNGEIDTAFRNSDLITSNAKFHPSPDGKILGSENFPTDENPTHTKLSRFFSNGKLDTSFHFPDTSGCLIGSVSNQNGELLLFFKNHEDSIVYYRRYLSNQNTLSSKFGYDFYTSSDPTKWLYSSTIGITKENYIYEKAITTNGLGSRALIRRKKSDGTLDTSFHSFISPWHQSVEVDNIGNISIYVTSGSGSKIYRYSPIGDFIDTFYLPKTNFKFAFQDTILSIGPDLNKRWTFEKKNSAGQIIVKRCTRFGFNGEVEKILIDQNDRILASGSFSEYDNHKSQGLIRLLPDGRPDTTFKSFPFSKPKDSETVLLNRFSNGDYLVVTLMPSGPNNRFMHRIKPNGSIDTSFGQTNFGDFSFSVVAVTSVLPMADGSFWAGITVNINANFNKGFIVKLLADASRDPAILPVGIEHQNFETWRAINLKLIDHNHILVASKLSREYPLGSIPWFDVGVLQLDSIGSNNYTSINNDFDFYHNGSAAPGIGNILVGGEDLKKLSLSGVSDTTFTTRQWNGQAFAGPHYILQVLKNQDVITSNFRKYRSENLVFQNTRICKINKEGIEDTSFVKSFINGSINHSLEPDSLHLYLAGDLIQYGDYSINNICRIHNRNSEIQLSKKPSIVTERVVLYPNPAQNKIFFSHVKPETEVIFYSTQGKLWHKANFEKESMVSIENWPTGIYFWRSNHLSGKVQTGKLIKE